MTQTLPPGWTDTACPKGHLRAEHEYLVKGTGRRRCRQCDRENRERAAAMREEGISLQVDKILMVCGCTVLYRRGTYTRWEGLWCLRHGYNERAAVE